MANNNEEIFKNVISHAKEYGFIFQSSEIYDGLSAVYDYGQLGAELKNNIKTYWWKAMVQMHENIVGIDSAIFMHPKVWKASGHVDGFNDPMIDNKDSKKRYRADQLIEDKITAYDAEGEKQKAESLQIEMDNALKSEDLPRLKKAWLAGGSDADLYRELRQLTERGWSIQTAKYSKPSFQIW